MLDVGIGVTLSFLSFLGYFCILNLIFITLGFNNPLISSYDILLGLFCAGIFSLPNSSSFLSIFFKYICCSFLAHLFNSYLEIKDLRFDLFLTKR